MSESYVSTARATGGHFYVDQKDIEKLVSPIMWNVTFSNGNSKWSCSGMVLLEIKTCEKNGDRFELSGTITFSDKRVELFFGKTAPAEERCCKKLECEFTFQPAL